MGEKELVEKLRLLQVKRWRSKGKKNGELISIVFFASVTLSLSPILICLMALAWNECQFYINNAHRS